MKPLLAAWLAALVTVCGAAQARAERYVVLGSTTSVENSGLLAHILPAFTAESGISVRVVAQGTGQALATAARGDADLVLVHDPVAEDAFVAAGHGVLRRRIAWNDFVVVGPATDPARIAGGHDAVAAFRAIAQARAAFVSRGDASGTDAFEKRVWREAGLDPAREGAAWYRDIGGGMGAALNAAAAMDAYTLADRGTWLSFANKRSLGIAVQGGRALINRYDVITLNPAEHASERHADAAKLAEWLVSAPGQAAIGAYTVDGAALFHPVADPEP